MNPWVYLVQSTTKVILHISIKFLEHFFLSKRVIRLNLYVKLVQSTTKVILHIFTEFQVHVSGNHRVTRMNPWLELVQSTPKLYYTSSLSSKDILLKTKELLK